MYKRQDFEIKKSKLKNNKDYWITKIEENLRRDAKNDKLLNELGWISVHFWSKDIEGNLSYCLNVIEDFIDYQMIGRL